MWSIGLKDRRSRRPSICSKASMPARFSVALIDGVTGSGKTEVYFEAIAATSKAGKQVLILLPEIALTASFLERFQDRFGSQAGRMAFRPAARCAKKSGGR
jgi:primosomal protein N' (replication factor Y)